MAQVMDRNIGANPTGFNMRTEINNIIAALESDNSGSSEPLNQVPYMKWLDTSDATYYYVKERNHDNTAWVTLFRYTVATKIMEAVSNGVVLSQTNIANEIHVSTSKTIPVDADEIGLIDSAATFGLKKLTWANLKATLKTYFDTLYVALTGTQTIAGVKTFSSSPIVPVPTAVNQAISMGNIIEKTGVGIGYGTGSGGTVTQLTSKATSVTINKVCGQITMNSESLAAGATANMNVINNMNFSTNGDVVVVSGRTGDASAGSYTYTVSNSSNGSFYIAVRNITAGARAEPLVINFAIIKGTTA